MSLKERTINVDIMTKEYTKLKYKQGDSNQTLKFKFYKNGSELDLTGYVAGIFYEKSNNEILEKTGNISANTVTTTITSGILNTSGIVKTEIFLTKNDEVSISFTILIEVESSIDKNAAVQEKEEWDIIKDLLTGGASIDDTTTATNKTWSSSKIDSQIKEIATITYATSDSINENINTSNNLFIPNCESEISTIIVNNKYNINISGSTNTFLKLKNNTDKLIDVSNVNTFKLKSLIFDLNINNQINEILDNITFLNSDTIIIEDCTFTNSFFRCIGCNNIKKLIIKNCVFKNIKGSALQLLNVDNLKITDCIFEDIGDERTHRSGSAIYTSNCKNIIISNNIIKNTSDSAIYINFSTSGKIIVTNNTIENCGKEGIKTQSNSSRSIISNNIIDGCNINGISCNFNSGATNITNNQIYNTCLNQDLGRGTALGAINIMSTHNAIVSNNILKGTRWSNSVGVYCVGSSTYGPCSNIQITNNQIFYCAGEGIKIQNSTSTIISGNICSQNARNMTGYSNQLYIQELKGTITSNHFSNSREERWEGYVLSSNTFKLQQSCPTSSTFYDNTAITFYYVKYDNSLQEVNRNIVSYDSDNKIITLDGNSILEELNVSEGTNLKYLIQTLSKSPQNQVRFYGSNSNITFLGNTLQPSQKNSYIMDSSTDNFKVSPLPSLVFNNMGDPKTVNYIRTGNTSQRPNTSIIGYQYFDTSLQKLIIWNGENWKDANGATV